MHYLSTALYLLIVAGMTAGFFKLYYWIGGAIGKMDEKLMKDARRKQGQQQSQPGRDPIRERMQQARQQSMTDGDAHRQEQERRQRQQQYRHEEQVHESRTEHAAQEADALPKCLEVLGFTKVPDDKAAIKVRYHKLARVYHPDDGGDSTEFQRLNEAWDEAKRMYGLD